MGRRSVAKATAIITTASILSKCLGFARETVVAKFFGATSQTDAYLVAFIIPGVILSLLGGALPGTMIPVFTEFLGSHREDRAWRMSNTLTNLIIITLSLGAILGWYLAPTLVPLLAPGFSQEVIDLAVYLTRIMMPMVVFLTLSGLATAILQSYQKFAFPALMGIPYSITMILFLVAFGQRLGIVGLALATVLAGISQCLFLLPALSGLAKRRRSGIPVGEAVGKSTEKVPQARFKFLLDLKDPAVAQVGRLIIPILIAGAVGQINAIVDRTMASRLPEGSIAALNYGHKVMALPLGLFVGAITTAIYPSLSLSIAQGKLSEFKRGISDGLRMVSLIMIPSAVGLLVLGEPIIQLLFQRGAFTHEATILSNQALRFYALGLLPLSFQMIIAKAFWAYQDTWSPLKVSVIAVLSNIAFNFIFIGPLGHGGLALGTTLSVVVWVSIMTVLLRRKVGPLGGGKIVASLVRVSLAGLVMGICVLQVYKLLLPQGLLLSVAGSILCGIIIYVFGLVLFGVEEAKSFASLLRGRLAKE